MPHIIHTWTERKRREARTRKVNKMTQYVTQEMEQWASGRETSELVAVAIHNISDNPDDLWEDPGVNGVDDVKAEMRNILKTTPELADEDNEYFWGIEIINL